MMLRWTVFLCALLMVAPAYAQKSVDEKAYSAEMTQALKELQQLDQRITAIGYRLTVANAAFCDDRIKRAGLLFHDINQYADQDVARHALGIDGPIAIAAVAPDSPAAQALLKAGDTVLAINNRLIINIPTSDPAFAEEAPDFRRIAAINKAWETALAKGETVLTVGDAEEMRHIDINSVQACPSQFAIRVNAGRNASADGKLVSITSKLAEYFQSDDEFASVVAHELAHNLLKHRDRLNAQKVNRGFFGQFGKSAKRIKKTEIEADRLSIWLMTNAGYDPVAAIRFWTRYGKEHGKGIFSAPTHYRWKKRVKLFEEEIARMAKITVLEGKRAPPLLIKNQ